jgi:hypothetical protein
LSATSSDPDGGTPSMRTSGVDSHNLPAGRDTKCYTVCPDYTVVEHPCGEPHACIDKAEALR